MGCDIHTWAEVREAGAWRKVGCIWPCEYSDGGLTGVPYWRRNYDLFAILAGVRNSDERIAPIAEPRGWPADATAEGKAEHHEFAAPDGHSLSWHSLRHLLEYPLWHATFTQHGVLNGPSYEALKQTGRPNGWWGVEWPPGRIVTEKTLLRRLAEGKDTEKTYVRMSWPVTYRRAAEPFVIETIPRLLALASPDPCVTAMADLALAGEKTALLPLQDWLTENERPGLDDVRMIFFFDN